MLKHHLTSIKGRLLNHFTETYANMLLLGACMPASDMDYAEYYEDCERCVKEIMLIKSVGDLDIFCCEWGLNELGNEFELSFYNLAKKYLTEKLPATK